MPFFVSLFLLTMIPPTYAVSTPEMDSPFVQHCTGEFASSAEEQAVNRFQSKTEQMLAAHAFRLAPFFSTVASREACICFESAYSAATGPSSPLSIDDLWNSYLALERSDLDAVKTIMGPLHSLPQREKDRILALLEGSGSAMTSCTAHRVQAIQNKSVLFGLNLQVAAALRIIP